MGDDIGLLDRDAGRQSWQSASTNNRYLLSSLTLIISQNVYRKMNWIIRGSPNVLW